MKCLLITICLIILSACNKNNIVPDPNNIVHPDYSAFLAKTNMSFNSFTQNGIINLNFGVGTAQGIAGYENSEGCDSANPMKVGLFGLTSEIDSGQTRFWLNTPPYNINTADSADIAAMFNTGIKKLGSMGKNFSLTILQNKNYYQSNDTCANSTIEILKTENFFDEYGKKRLRVWFKIDGKLININDGANPLILNKGFMIANFWNFCNAYK